MKSFRRTLTATAGALLITATPLIAFAAGGGGTLIKKTVQTSPIPEPGSLLLFAAGAVVVGAAVRRKRS